METRCSSSSTSNISSASQRIESATFEILIVVCKCRSGLRSLPPPPDHGVFPWNQQDGLVRNKSVFFLDPSGRKMATLSTVPREYSAEDWSVLRRKEQTAESFRQHHSKLMWGTLLASIRPRILNSASSTSRSAMRRNTLIPSRTSQLVRISLSRPG